MLLVCGDPRVGGDLRRWLRRQGHAARAVADPDAAERAIRRQPFDVLIVDATGPGADVERMIRHARASTANTPVIVIDSGAPSTDKAMSLLAAGATEYLHADDVDSIGGLVADLVNGRHAAGDRHKPRGKVRTKHSLIGGSSLWLDVCKLAARFAATDITILIRGEPGTGKGLLARRIHEISPYSDGPFVVADCPSIPESLAESELFGHVKGAFTDARRDRKGLFERAGRGTLVLDEIGDLSLVLQPKLLRVLQDREFTPVGAETLRIAHARVVAVTNRALEDMVATGSFRADLYDRLRVAELVIPPLRERTADIPVLAEYFIDDAIRWTGIRSRPRLTEEANAALIAYEWPGNVRELEHVLASAVLSAAEVGVIRPSDLRLRAAADGIAPRAVRTRDRTILAGHVDDERTLQRQRLFDALEATGGNQSKAAAGDNLGCTWSEPVPVSENATRVAVASYRDHTALWVAPGPGDPAHARPTVLMRVSGAAPAPVAPPPDHEAQRFAGLGVDADGTIQLFWVATEPTSATEGNASQPSGRADRDTLARLVTSSLENGDWSKPTPVAVAASMNPLRATGPWVDELGDLNLIIPIRTWRPRAARLLHVKGHGVQWLSETIEQAPAGYPNAVFDGEGSALLVSVGGARAAGSIDVNSVWLTGLDSARPSGPQLIHRSGTQAAFEPKVRRTGELLHAVWARDIDGVTASREGLMYSTSEDGGVSWSSPVAIDSAGHVRRPDVLAVGDGGVLVTYEKSAFPGAPAVIRVGRSIGTDWSVRRLLERVDVNDLAVSVDSNATIHVVFSTFSPRERHAPGTAYYVSGTCSEQADQT